MNTTHGWIVVGLLPAVFDAPPIGVLGWAVALIVGSLFADRQSLRWVAIGWAASAIARGTPLLGVAVGGSVCEDWRSGLRAAALGSVLGLLGLPELMRQAGLWLILAACAVALQGGRDETL